MRDEPQYGMTQPQDADLVEVVREFLARLDDDPFLVLRVFDPVTRRSVEIVNHDLQEDELDEEEGIVFATNGAPVIHEPSWDLRMSFFWPVPPETEQVARLAPVARRLGFPPPWIEQVDLVLIDKTYPTVPRAWRSVEGLDAAAIAGLCLDVHRDVFGRKPSQCLRTSVGPE